MPASSDEITYARSYIGNTETDDTFNERVDRLDASGLFGDRVGVIDAAVEESMRAQLSAYIMDAPSSASLPGGISQSTGANIQTLAQQLKDFRNTTSRGVQVGRLVRQRQR